MKQQFSLSEAPDTPDLMQQRSRGVAVLLAVLLGMFGVHLFYLGYHGLGSTRLLVALAGLGLAALAIPVGNSVGNGLSGAFIGVGMLVFGGGAVLGMYLISLVDAVRIITGDLRPRNGEYHPSFFQNKPRSGPANN